MADEPDGRRVIRLVRPLDLRATLAVDGVKGPCLRIRPDGLWRATRTPQGPAAVRMRLSGRELDAGAWGEGAEWALEHVPQWIGENDDPDALVPRHPELERAARLGRGMRMCAVGGLTEVLVSIILAQKVTGVESSRSYRLLTARYGEPAPGPGNLPLPPHPSRLAQLAYYDFHPLGVERRRAETVLRACRAAPRLEAAARGSLDEMRRLLHSLPGIGPWTSANVAQSVRGDADAVPVGDFHAPNTVAWALAGEARASDERMLELLAPYAGQRGRVVRLLERYSGRAPAYGPRTAPRDIRPL